MKMKKIIAALMTATMVMSVGVVASASATSNATINATTNATQSGSQTIEGTGDVKSPIISVNMPTKFTFLIDPYGINGAGTIASPKINIENKSNVNVDVKLTSMKAKMQNTASGAAADGVNGPLIQGADWGADDAVLGGVKGLYLWIGGYGATFNAEKDAEKVVTDVSGTEIPLSGTTSMGILGKATYNEDNEWQSSDSTNGTLTIGVNGKANTQAVWGDKDGVDVTPTFSIVPTIASPNATKVN